MDSTTLSMKKDFVNVAEVSAVTALNDKIDIVNLKNYGFNIHATSGNFKPGDTVVYFPVYSIIPKNLQKFIDSKSTKKNIIIPTKVDGHIGEGQIISVADLKLKNVNIGDEVSGDLGVTKHDYEYVEYNGNDKKYVDPKTGSKTPWSFPYTMTRNAKYHMDVIEQWRKEEKPVVIEEFIDGIPISVSYNKTDDKIFVNTQTHTLELKQYTTDMDQFNDAYIGNTDDEKVWDKCKYFLKNVYPNEEQITIYCVLFGETIKNNNYKLGYITLRILDLYLHTSNTFVNFDDKMIYLKDAEDDCPQTGYSRYIKNWYPIVYGAKVTIDAFLNGRSYEEAASGVSGVAGTQTDCDPSYEHPNLKSAMRLYDESLKYMEYGEFIKWWFPIHFKTYLVFDPETEDPTKPEPRPAVLKTPDRPPYFLDEMPMEDFLEGQPPIDRLTHIIDQPTGAAPYLLTDEENFTNPRKGFTIRTLDDNPIVLTYSNSDFVFNNCYA